MSTKVECPICGLEVCARGLEIHKHSMRCTARENKNEMKDRGYKPLKSVAHVNYAKKHYSSKIVSKKTKYHEGSKYNRAYLSKEVWVPESIDADIIENKLARYSQLRNSSQYAFEKMYCDGDYMVLVSRWKEKPEFCVAGVTADNISSRRKYYIVFKNTVYKASDGIKVGNKISKCVAELDIYEDDKGELQADIVSRLM